MNSVRFLFGIFLLTFSRNAPAQIGNDSFFHYDTSFNIELDAQLIERKDWGKTSCFDEVHKVLYIPLKVDFSSKQIVLLTVNIENSKSKLLKLKFPKKAHVENRCTVSGCRIFHEHLFLNVCGNLLEFDDKGNFVESTTYGDKWEYFNIFPDGTRALAFYDNYHFLTSREKCGLLLDNRKENTKEETYFPPGFYQFTMFTPNELFCANSKFIFRVDVAKPIIYTINQNSEIIDSLFIPIEKWVYPESLISLPKYKPLYEAGAFEFGSQALQDTCSKSLAIKMVNDSTLLYISCNSMINTQERILKIDSGGKLQVVAFRSTDQKNPMAEAKANPDLPIVNNEIDFFMMMPNSMYKENRLFYIALGPSKTLDEGNYTDYKNALKITPPKGKVYLNIYSFRFF